jgi:hypothetical protein
MDYDVAKEWDLVIVCSTPGTVPSWHKNIRDGAMYRVVGTYGRTSGTVSVVDPFIGGTNYILYPWEYTVWDGH